MGKPSNQRLRGKFHAGHGHRGPLASTYVLVAATAVFLLTYVLISLRQVARFPLERPASAMLGAGLMLALGGTGTLVGLSALLSNLISNVPAVLFLAEVVEGSGGTTHQWLVRAASSTLAGNATILGAAANVIVVQAAAREGAHASMRDFVRAGLPVTAVTLVLSTALLALLVPA